MAIRIIIFATYSLSSSGGRDPALCNCDVWQIQELTEPSKSCVLSCLIWMSLQHIQVEGLSVRRAFRAELVLGAVLTLIKTLTECTRNPFVGMTCQMDEESVCVYWVQFSFKRTSRSAAVFSEANSTLIFNTGIMQNM